MNQRHGNYRQSLACWNAHNSESRILQVHFPRFRISPVQGKWLSRMNNSTTNVVNAEILQETSAKHLVDALKLRLAVQVAPVRWQTSLGSLADAIERGEALEEVVQAGATQMPKELRCLVEESAKLPEPGRFLVECLKARSEIRASWRDLARLCIYPTCLLVFALLVGVSFSFCMNYMIDTTWIEDFGLAGVESTVEALRDQHHAMISMALILGWIGLMLVTVYFAGPPWAWVAVMGGVMLIGKPLRWLHMREILHRYYLFVSQGLSLPEASRAVSRSFSASSQAIVTRKISERIEAGATLGHALASSLLSDGICRPMLFMMDQSSDLTSAIQENAQLLGRLVDRRCRGLSSMVPVFMLLGVGAVAWSALTVYFLGLSPMITMITMLATLDMQWTISMIGRY